MLNNEQQLEIIELLKDKPNLYNIDDAYAWSAQNINKLLINKLKINLPLSTIRDYLNKWFNTKQTKRGNQIKKILEDNNLLDDIKKDEAIVLYFKKYIDGFIHIVTRNNENKFIYMGNKNTKNLLDLISSIISYHSDKSIYIIFENIFFSISLFDKLLNKNKYLRIFYLNSPIINFLKNEESLFNVNEFKISKIRRSKTKNPNMSVKCKGKDEILVNDIDFNEEELVSFTNQLESTDNISEGIEINIDITKLINDLE